MMTLSTSYLRPPLRFAHWHHCVEDLFGPLRIETNAKSLQHAVVRRVSLGAVTLVVCESPPLRLTRLCSVGADHPLADHLGLEVLCSGRSTQMVDGREIRLNVGDLLLHYRGENYWAEYTEPGVSAILLIPMERYTRHYHRIQADLNRVVSAAAPGAAILSATMRATAEALRNGMPEYQLSPLANALLELVDMVYLGDTFALTDAAPRHSLSRQALAYVEQMLPNPALSVRSIAESLRVSVRTVHEIFRREGCAPSRYILQRRLERSAAYLRGPGTDRIADIAQAVGFDDPAYFSRAFRRQFGTAPLRYRKQAAQISPATASR